MANQTAAARIQFMQWVKDNFPELYQAAVARADESTISALGEDASWWEKARDAVIGFGTTYLTLKNQRDAMKINLERAQQGLPPIDPATTAPAIRTQIDLDPAVVSKITAGAGLQINKILLVAGAALVAFMLLRR